MTISTTVTKSSASGNGSTHSFAYGFKIFANADLQVIIRSSTGAETVKTLDTHYIVTGAGSASGGNVLFKYNTGDSSDAHYSTSDYRPASGETVIIRRALALSQSTDYIENDTFSASDHENALDQLTMVAQELQEQLDRSFKVSRTNTITTPEFTTGASDRAGAYLLFNADGSALTTSTVTAGQYSGGDGTVSAPFYSFTSDLNTGFYRIGADNVGLTLGGTKRVDFGASTTAFTGEVTATGFTGTLDGILGSGTPAAATVTQLTSGGNIVSDTDSTDDLGTTSVRWANLYVDAVTTTNNTEIGGNLTVTGNLTINGTTVTNDATNVEIKDPLIELNSGATSNASDLGLIFERGSTGQNTGIIWDESSDHFATILTDATGSSTGNITYSFAPFKCSTLTATAGTLAGLTSLAMSAGATLTAGFLDEDDMASDSAVAGVTQQSVKAYVDNNAPENGVKFAFESNTNDTDQGAGKVFLSSDNTVLYVDDVEAGGVSVNAWVDSWDDVSNSVARGYVYLASYGSTNAIKVFKVTGSVTSASTYSKVPVSLVLAVGSFSDGDSVGLTFIPSGADGSGSLSDVVDDTSPQLGGDLDVNGNDITSASNADVDINPNGTGNVVLKTDLVSVGGGSEVGHVSSNGAFDMKISSNSGTNSGTILITDGANGAITLAPNGTGIVDVQGSMNSSISTTGKSIVFGF